MLEELDRCANVSQRSLAERLGTGASRINRQIREFLEAGHVEVVDAGVKPFAYRLTREGREYRQRLSHQHYRSVLGDLRDVRDRITRRLRDIQRGGVRRVVFYGSGDVMEVTYPLAKSLGLDVVGLVDDDESKHGSAKGSMVIGPPNSINELEPDAVVITTFRHAGEIRGKIDPGLRPSMTIIEL